MQETTFRTVGVLPIAEGRWHIRQGGGHTYFVNEDPDVDHFALVDGSFVRAVDGIEQGEAPLIQPRVPA